MEFAIDSEWGSGYGVTLSIGSATGLEGWSATFNLPEGHGINNFWNCELDLVGQRVTLRGNADWNRDVRAGRKVSVGFIATKAPGSEGASQRDVEVDGEDCRATLPRITTDAEAENAMPIMASFEVQTRDNYEATTEVEGSDPSDGGLSTGAIAGIGALVVAACALVATGVLLAAKKRRDGQEGSAASPVKKRGVKSLRRSQEEPNARAAKADAFV